MKRLIITTMLLASLVLLGCEDPSANLNSGHGNYGDIRDSIQLGYQFSDADVEFFADYGIDQSMMDALDTWTPEQVAAYTEAILTSMEMAFEYLGTPEGSDRLTAAQESANTDGFGAVDLDFFRIEYEVREVEPISTTRTVREVVHDDGTVEQIITLDSVYDDEGFEPAPPGTRQ